MARRYYDLPSLTALAAFEAVARHRSFTLAAAEFNVTPGAVSRQIKTLEGELGTPVFERLAGGIALTVDGADLYAVLSGAFARASETVHRIKTGNRSRSVTFACTNAVAMMWLMPRMGAFWRRFPDIEVDHLISDNPRDYRRADVDLRIRYGFGAWPDERSRLLLDETIYPVAGPGFASAHAGCKREDIASLPLLHVDWVDPDWTGWAEFLSGAGIPHGPLAGRRFNSFAVTLQATEEDQGIALGWHQLVAQRIKQGRLVRFTDLTLPAPGGYYLTWNENRELSSAASTLRDWLLETAAVPVQARSRGAAASL